MVDRYLSVGPVASIEEGSVVYGQQHPNRSSEQNICIQQQQRTSPVLDNLRRNHLDLWDSNDNSLDVALTAVLQQALGKSTYGLADVHCAVDSSTVRLFGIVRSYFALQMAIQLARGIAAGRCIELEVDVVPRVYGDYPAEY